MKFTSALRKAADAALRRGNKPALQVGALPYRRREDGAMEVLLVTTRGTGQWMVPKGWPMSGKSWSEAAAQEAWEEAGVKGAAAKTELGRFRHAKTDVILGSRPCVVAVFPLAVEEEHSHWPERGERVRSWFQLDEAVSKVRSRELAGLIKAARSL
jgi:8-oxo-dGTP pyrophosphatase MutT (NUDIX family)